MVSAIDSSFNPEGAGDLCLSYKESESPKFCQNTYFRTSSWPHVATVIAFKQREQGTRD